MTTAVVENHPVSRATVYKFVIDRCLIRQVLAVLETMQ